MSLAEHQHGKARVRLGRTWRVPQPDGSVRHVFVEWSVQTALESDMAHAFTSPSNAGMTATDTQRNTVREEEMCTSLWRCLIGRRRGLFCAGGRGRSCARRNGTFARATRPRALPLHLPSIHPSHIHPLRTHSRTPPTHPPAHPSLSQQVYYVAKQLDAPCSPEEFGLALARHFLDRYPLVSRAKVRVSAAPWARHHTGGEAGGAGRPHAHGFEGGGGSSGGGGERLAFVSATRERGAVVVGGVSGWRVLKTTQSGYEGFHRDAWTALPDSRDRILATSVSATWRYTRPAVYDAAFSHITAALARAFFGPPTAGVYSPSVQYTAHDMARAALDAEPAIDSVALSLPNLHFLPCAPLGDQRGFENDVYVATSEPHGVIEAVIVREAGVEPHVRLWSGDGLGPSARL
jgi:urate oxidase